MCGLSNHKFGFTNLSSNANVSTAGLQSVLMSALKKTAAQQSKTSVFDDEFVKPICGW